MTTHTPGPWRELRNGYTKKHISGLPIMTTVIESPSAIICEMWDRKSADRVAAIDEQDANARLIAKAPEMRAMIDGLLCDPNDAPGPLSWVEMVRAARALLAEIDGGTK